MTSNVSPMPSMQPMHLHLRTPVTAKLSQSDTSVSPGIFAPISLPFKKRRSRSIGSESSSSTSLPFKKRRFLIIPIASSSDDETDRVGSNLVALSPIAVPSLNANQEQRKALEQDASSSIACVTPVPSKNKPKGVIPDAKLPSLEESKAKLPSLKELDLTPQNQLRKTRSSATKSSETTLPESKQSLELSKKPHKTKSTTGKRRPRDTLYRGESPEEIRCLAISTRGKRCCYAAVACNGNEYCHRHTSSFAKKDLEANDDAITTTTISRQESTKSIPLRFSTRSRSVVVPAQEPPKTTPVAAVEASKTVQQSSPKLPRALSDLSSDLWENQRVRISNGPHKSKTATVLRWGNGWVTVELSSSKSSKTTHTKNHNKPVLHNRRSHDLVLV